MSCHLVHPFLSPGALTCFVVGQGQLFDWKSVSWSEASKDQSTEIKFGILALAIVIVRDAMSVIQNGPAVYGRSFH